MDQKKPAWRVVRAGEKPPRIITEALVPIVQCIEKMARIDRRNLEKKLKDRK